MWVRSCRLQLSNWRKPFLQCLHVYGFSPIQVCSDLRADLQTCAFPPVFVEISIKPGYDRLKHGAALSRKTFFPSLTRMLDLTPFQHLLSSLQFG